MTTNFGGVDVVGGCQFISSSYIQGHQFHPDTRENNNEFCLELLADVTLFSTLITQLYQHRPQIAKNNFCARSSPSTPTIAHYNGAVHWHPAMAPRPLPQSWPSPSPAIAHYNGTLQWHPAIAPRPLS